jgi:23S rRNA pseudouridine1911/1915/1917 synthase
LIRYLPIPDGLAGERLDAGLARLLGISRSRATELIAGGHVRLDGTPIAKSHRLIPGDQLEVDMTLLAAPAAPRTIQPVPGMGIVYDDADIVVVDKPAWVAAHPSNGWDGPNVLDALMASGFRITTSGAQERRGIVQRLDVGTSGLMVVAKSERAYSVLKRAFRERTPTRVYHALCQGHPEPPAGTIDAPIGRHRSGEYRFTVSAGGREAVTHYDTLELAPGGALVEIRLETGRTHQIRVHFQAIRHPLVGDLNYGADPTLAARLGLDRQWLHAVRLAFDHPVTGVHLDVRSEYPADLAAAWDQLRAIG